MIPELSGKPNDTGNAAKMSWGEGRDTTSLFRLIKIANAVHYSEGGGLLRDIRYLNESNGTNKWKKKVKIHSSGVFEFYPGGKPDKKVFFIPKRSKFNNPYFSWSCISRDYYNINYHIKECRFDKNYRLPERIQEERVRTHRILFKFNQSGEEGLSKYGQGKFKKFLLEITPTDYNQIVLVEITGYTDPMGSSRRNIKLADSRVAYVREAFAELGIDRHRISTRVIGADPKPVKPCPQTMLREERIECFAQSRRAVIKVTYKEDL